MNAYVTSLIRTVAPIIAGWLLSLPVAGPLLSLLGIHDGPGATAAVAGVLGAAYYALVRLLEKRWPQLGALLGVPAAPVYAAPAESVDPVATAVLGVPTEPPPPAAA